MGVKQMQKSAKCQDNDFFCIATDHKALEHLTFIYLIMYLIDL